MGLGERNPDLEYTIWSVSRVGGMLNLRWLQLGKSSMVGTGSTFGALPSPFPFWAVKISPCIDLNT